MRFMIMAASAALALGACSDQTPAQEAPTSVEADADLSDLVGKDGKFGEAIEAAGLGDVLSGVGPYTVLAPSDAAFDALPAGAFDALMAEDAREQLGQVLSYHIMPGTILAEDIGKAIDAGGGSATLPTLGPDTLTAKRDGEAIVLTDGAGGEVRITESDVEGSNGVVHRVDGVLMPS
ncbi:fasciclin domain-containing protein [Sphingomicrobium nitratireducens]|uniref:fasciclin domain-containing protein n=1 Tax=Sphingomicrobium nitratireducens TaxID=2964666 RepID=UPI00223FC74D|nr:fasciclin domain-containing protein [Sphingomicrobium nitratireducens]